MILEKILFSMHVLRIQCVLGKRKQRNPRNCQVPTLPTDHFSLCSPIYLTLIFCVFLTNWNAHARKWFLSACSWYVYCIMGCRKKRVGSHLATIGIGFVGKQRNKTELFLLIPRWSVSEFLIRSVAWHPLGLSKIYKSEFLGVSLCPQRRYQSQIMRACAIKFGQNANGVHASLNTVLGVIMCGFFFTAWEIKWGKEIWKRKKTQTVVHGWKTNQKITLSSGFFSAMCAEFLPFRSQQRKTYRGDIYTCDNDTIVPWRRILPRLIRLFQFRICGDIIEFCAQQKQSAASAHIPRNSDVNIEFVFPKSNCIYFCFVETSKTSGSNKAHAMLFKFLCLIYLLFIDKRSNRADVIFAYLPSVYLDVSFSAQSPVPFRRPKNDKIRTKSGRPDGVTSASSLSWRTPPPLARPPHPGWDPPPLFLEGNPFPVIFFQKQFEGEQ